MISHKYKFIFVHIPSTGGTSIQEVLTPICDIVPATGYLPAHLTISQIYKQFEYDKLKDYFMFGVVRNPWDRMVSRYHYLKKIFPENKFSFEEWLFGEVFRQNNKQYGSDNIIKKTQQLFYLKHNNKVEANFIGRFENIQNDFDIITDMIGIDRITLPKKNSTEHKPFEDYYTEELINIVANLFKDDITYFNYNY